MKPAILALLLCLPLSAQTWPRDKVGHASIGFAIAFGGAAAKRPKLAFGVAVAAAVGKELWDRKHPPHDPELADAGVTIWGAALGYGFGRLVFGRPEEAHKPVDPVLALELQARAERAQ